MFICWSAVAFLLFIAVCVFKPQWVKWIWEFSKKVRAEMDKPVDLFAYQNSQLKAHEARVASDHETNE